MLAARERRLKQWNTEREHALAEARAATAEKVKAGKAEIDQSVAVARQQIEGVSAELSEQILRAVMPAGLDRRRLSEEREAIVAAERAVRANAGVGAWRWLTPAPDARAGPGRGRRQRFPAQAADAEKKPPEQDETDTYRKSPSRGGVGREARPEPRSIFPRVHLFNFLLLAAAFVWVAAKMLPKFFRDRSAGIQKHLVDARTATEEARARLSGVEARLAKLDDEIAAMRAHAEQDSAREEQRIKASVEDEKRKILTEAEHEITVATMHAQKLLQQHAAELAIEQAARKLVVSAETDRLLVQSFASG